MASNEEEDEVEARTKDDGKEERLMRQRVVRGEATKEEEGEYE